MNSKHFIGIHGYMLVYSVASLQSFEMIQVIREKLLNHLVSLTPPKRQSPSNPLQPLHPNPYFWVRLTDGLTSLFYT